MKVHVSPFGIIDIDRGQYFDFEEFLEHIFLLPEECSFEVCISPNFQILVPKDEFPDASLKTDIRETTINHMIQSAGQLSTHFEVESFESMIRHLTILSKNCLSNFIAYHFYKSKGFLVRNAKSFGFSYMLTAKGEIHSGLFVKVLRHEESATFNDILLWTRIATNMNKVRLLEAGYLPS